MSAFNNAGFSLFPTNLVAYRGDWFVNLAVSALIVGGGIGFVVFSDLVRWARKEVNHPLLHTKIVLAATGVLVAGGTAVLWMLERSNPQSIGALSFPEQALVSLFHSVAARTAGFNTVDLSTFTPLVPGRADGPHVRRRFPRRNGRRHQDNDVRRHDGGAVGHDARGDGRHPLQEADPDRHRGQVLLHRHAGP